MFKSFDFEKNSELHYVALLTDVDYLFFSASQLGTKLGCLLLGWSLAVEAVEAGGNAESVMKNISNNYLMSTAECNGM